MKIKLLIIKYSMPLGGAETLILQHIDNLNRDKFDIHFMTVANKGILQSDAKEKSAFYSCLNRKSAFDFLLIIKLRRYIIKHNIEVVHCHDWISALYLSIASRGLSIKKIVTIHSQGQSWQELATSYILKKMDLIICVSKTQKLSLFEKGTPWKKMKVIYNCFNSSRFRLYENNNHANENETFRVVMVGNFYWQKDQQTLIKAINSVRKRGHKIELQLVGRGNSDSFKQSEKLVNNLNLESIVSFHDNIRVDGNFLAKFNLFVFSTKSERLPISPMEAMASSLAVLVSDIPPNMELIRYGQDGYYFETGNSADCADKIIEIINNPIEFQIKKESGFNRAKQFTPAIIVQSLEACYESILN